MLTHHVVCAAGGCHMKAVTYDKAYCYTLKAPTPIPKEIETK